MSHCKQVLCWGHRQISTVQRSVVKQDSSHQSRGHQECDGYLQLSRSPRLSATPLRVDRYYFSICPSLLEKLQPLLILYHHHAIYFSHGWLLVVLRLSVITPTWRVGFMLCISYGKYRLQRYDQPFGFTPCTIHMIFLYGRSSRVIVLHDRNIDTCLET